MKRSKLWVMKYLRRDESCSLDEDAVSVHLSDLLSEMEDLKEERSRVRIRGQVVMGEFRRLQEIDRLLGEQLRSVEAELSSEGFGSLRAGVLPSGGSV